MEFNDLFKTKSLVSQYSIEDFKASEKLEVNEIFPGIYTAKEKVEGSDALEVTTPKEFTIMNLAIPIGDNKTIIWTSSEGKTFLDTGLGVNVEAKTIKDLFDISGLEMPSISGLDFQTMTEKFSEFQKSVKDQFDSIFKKE